LVEFDNAIKLKPGNVQSHFEKGDTLALLGCFDEAIDEMNKAIELNPRNADYHYFKGLVHTSMKDYEKALMEFDSSLELLPDSSEFHQAKTEALIQLGRTTEALEEQNKVHTMTEDFERHPLRYEGALEIRRGYFFQKLDEK
jgi:tetratricopeptide (TPR) repeat protein